MPQVARPHGYWTESRLRKEALKYPTRNRFKLGSSGAFDAARRKGLLGVVCAHMICPQNPRDTWTKSVVALEASKFATRSDFKSGSSGAYKKALKQGWLDDVCKHMHAKGNVMRRAVYVIKTTDGSRQAYVGLSYDPESRYMEHLGSRGKPYVKELLQKPHSFVFGKLLSADRAARLEAATIVKLRKEDWIVVNRSAGGTLGGDRLRWTFEACLEEASYYDSRKAFQIGSGGAYDRAHKQGRLDLVCVCMEPRREQNWTLNKVQLLAQSCKTLAEFRSLHNSAYSWASKQKILEQCFANLQRTHKPKGYWTLVTCLAEANLCKTFEEFKQTKSAAYNASCKKRIVADIRRAFEAETAV